MANIIRRPFRYSYFNATLIIIGINVAVFLLGGLYPVLVRYLSLNIILCKGYNMWWQVATYMFVHGSFQHLFFNMLGLLFFGLPVERTIGSREFLLLYLLCGTLNGIVAFFGYYFSGMFLITLMGASGALYSILLVYAVIFPKSIIYVFWVIPVPAPILVLVYAVIEFFGQFGGGNIAHSVHLMGFVLAWIYLVVRMGLNPIRVWKNAWRR